MSWHESSIIIRRRMFSGPGMMTDLPEKCLKLGFDALEVSRVLSGLSGGRPKLGIALTRSTSDISRALGEGHDGVATRLSGVLSWTAPTAMPRRCSELRASCRWPRVDTYTWLAEALAAVA